MIIQSIYNKLSQEYHNLALWYFVSYILGIVYFFNNPFVFSFELCLLVILCLLALVIFRQNLLLFYFLSLCCMFLLGVTISAAKLSSINIKPLKKSKIVELEAMVQSINPTLKGHQIILGEINSGYNLSKVRVNVADKNIRINKGDKVRLTARLFPLNSSILPESYDFGFYLYMSGISATGYSLSKPEIIAHQEDGLNNIINRLRLKVFNRLIEVMGHDKGSFVAAILIGETKAIPEKVAQDMRDTGVAHILSISGLHLSLVAMICFLSSRVVLNISNYMAYNFNIKIIAAIISCVGSFLYLLISGGNIAATRAFIMTSIFIIAIIFGRSVYPLRSVMIAAFLILVFLPEYLSHPSFQLSFSAVLCLIGGYNFFTGNNFISRKSSGLFYTVKLYVFTNIYSSLLASIVTAPYVIFHFYKFANYSVIMNLIAVPIMSFFMMPLALGSLVLMTVNLDLWVLKLLGFFVDIVIDSAGYIASMPYAVWYTGNISGLSLLLYSLGFFWITFWQTGWKYYGLLLIIISLLLMIFTPKPDFIYDHNYKMIAMLNERGEIELYSKNKISKFTADYWANWFGQKNANVIITDIERSDILLELKNNKLVAVLYNQCLSADYAIIASKTLKCSNYEKQISYEHLINIKQILAYCPWGRECNFDFTKKSFWENSYAK